MKPTARDLRANLLPTLVGSILVLTLIGLALYGSGGDPTVFVGFGEDAEATLQYAEAHLGDVAVRVGQGHDGKYFFVQAHDPLVLHPEDNAAILDFPVYRSQRMLYPLVAGGLGLLDSEGILWGLLVVSVLAFVAGTYLTSRLAQELGGSAWWGLAFALNVGFIYTMTSDLSDVLAGALGIAAILAVYRARWVGSVVLLSAAALSREVLVICAVGVGIYWWTTGKKRVGLLSVGIPGGLLLAWTLYLRWRLGPDAESTKNLGLPFVGLVRAVGDWLESWATVVTGAATVTLLLLLVIRWWRSRTPLGWGFVGFAPLAIVMTEKVWKQPFDFTRALAPALTAALLVVFVERASDGVPSGAIEVDSSP